MRSNNRHLVVISRGILVQPFKPISEHATKFGRLFPYTPKASFKHFKTEDGYQVDFIYRRKDNKYQFLSKSKIK